MPRTNLAATTSAARRALPRISRSLFPRAGGARSRLSFLARQRTAGEACSAVSDDQGSSRIWHARHGSNRQPDWDYYAAIIQRLWLNLFTGRLDTRLPLLSGSVDPTVTFEAEMLTSQPMDA
ncbi:hypothetical protein FZEAL_8250 [Fusarium zealandicum]|uniref:Uncharacterized protein n=1 Tax=Fusarium zealandicum TaxID=1053134 RepID=A0A8H4UEJ6_9HYPO|nr:hypothetical protein FZEAL_8250 [Fusarium zealandicum]